MVHSDISLDGLVVANTTAELNIRVNGTIVYSDFNGNIGAVRNAGNGFIMSINQIMLLNAGDVLSILLQVDGNGSKNVNTADGTFWLQPGTYIIEASAPCYNITSFQTALLNLTSTIKYVGDSIYQGGVAVNLHSKFLQILIIEKSVFFIFAICCI